LAALFDALEPGVEGKVNLLLGSPDLPTSHLDSLINMFPKYGVAHVSLEAHTFNDATSMRHLLDDHPATINVVVDQPGSKLQWLVSQAGAPTIYNCPVKLTPPQMKEELTDLPAAYIYDPENVARFVAQAFTALDPKYKEAILTMNTKKVGENVVYNNKHAGKVY
jgi:hypothetical protein